MSDRPAYSTYSGPIAPGCVSSDGGPFRSRLEKVLADVVGACGERLAVRLNEREADLLDRLMRLDEKGRAFRKDSMPEEVRNDPLGLKESERLEDEAQKARHDRIRDANAAASMRETEIKGEASETGGKKAGKAGKPDEGAKEAQVQKSGFERIMEENARIASGKTMDVSSALDPVGAHAVKDARDEGTAAETAEEAPDATRGADAEVPATEAPDGRNAMDRKAAEVAGGLSVLSAIDGPGSSRAKAKGKGRKSR